MTTPAAHYNRLFLDHVKRGKFIFSYRLPPKINSDIVEIFSDDLDSTIKEKLQELLDRKKEVEQDYLERKNLIDKAVEDGLDTISEWFFNYYAACFYTERIYILKWISYWVHLWEIVKKDQILEVSDSFNLTKKEIENAKEYPLEDLYEGNLRIVGKKKLGICPFHEERTASFTIFTEENKFHCFGCGANGDVIDFYQKLKEVDLVTAVKALQ